MIEAAAILEPTLVLPGRHATRDDMAAAFSFAGAVSALEARAAQSLETFGGAPQQGAAPVDGATAKDADKSAPSNDARASQPRAEGAAKAETANGAPRSADAARANGATSQNLAPAPQTVNATATPVAAATAAVAVQQQSAASPRTDTPIPGRVEPARTESLKAPRAPAPTAPPPSTENFAKLVARRLDAGATAFELRLDPPALGRVEAQLKLTDAGESTLSLKFENQAALDHFTRDEAALRMALSDAGYDLGRERLAFSLADRDGWRCDAADLAIAVEHYEPQFLAPYSRGVVDLRA